MISSKLIRRCDRMKYCKASFHPQTFYTKSVNWRAKNWLDLIQTLVIMRTFCRDKKVVGIEIVSLSLILIRESGKSKSHQLAKGCRLLLIHLSADLDGEVMPGMTAIQSPEWSCDAWLETHVYRLKIAPLFDTIIQFIWSFVQSLCQRKHCHQIVLSNITRNEDSMEIVFHSHYPHRLVSVERTKVGSSCHRMLIDQE